MSVFGEYLPALASSQDAFYTPWFARGGNMLITTVDVIGLTGAATLQVDVQTKDSEDSDDVGNATILATLGPAGVVVGPNTFQAGAPLQGVVPAVQELVRYKVTVQGPEGSGVFIRFLNPTWLNN